MYINYIAIKLEKIKPNYKLFKNDSAGGLKINKKREAKREEFRVLIR